MFAIHLAAIAVLLFIAIIDWQTHEIWHTVTIPTVALAIVAANQLPAASRVNAAFGALVAFGLVALLRLLAKQVYDAATLGFGDVMLAAVLGAIGGVVDGLLALAIGMLGAGMFAGWRLYHGADRHERFAYGTFLALGGILITVTHAFLA